MDFENSAITFIVGTCSFIASYPSRLSHHMLYFVHYQIGGNCAAHIYPRAKKNPCVSIDVRRAAVRTTFVCAISV